jgi:hypothetical protein
MGAAFQLSQTLAATHPPRVNPHSLPAIPFLRKGGGKPPHSKVSERVIVRGHEISLRCAIIKDSRRKIDPARNAATNSRRTANPAPEGRHKVARPGRAGKTATKTPSPGGATRRVAPTQTRPRRTHAA